MSEAPKKNILVVDDEPMILDLILKFLRSRNLNIICCSDPMRAIDMIEQHQIDAVITDFNMPSLNGVELLKDIRLKKGKEFPVIVISGFLDFDSITVGNVGSTYFMNKPVDFFKLELILNKELHHFRLVAPEDFKSIEYDGRFFIKNFRRGVAFEFIEMRDQQMVMSLKSPSATLGADVVIVVHCCFDKEDRGSFFLEGKITELQVVDDTKDVMVIDIQDDSKKDFRDFRSIYETRQTAIREFMSSAKGL